MDASSLDEMEGIQVRMADRFTSKTDVRGEPLLFSFKHFVNHAALSPTEHPDGYTQKLAERLRDLSRWTVAQFMLYDKGVRNHRITWSKTSHEAGFDHIPEQAREGRNGSSRYRNETAASKRLKFVKDRLAENRSASQNARNLLAEPRARSGR